MHNFTANMTCDDIELNLRQNQESIEIMLNNKAKKLGFNVAFNYGQIRELMNGITTMLSHTDIKKINKQTTGSVIAKYNYHDNIVVSGGEEICQPQNLSAQMEVKSI